MVQPKQDRQGPRHYEGEKARQGEIILRSRRRRVVFIAGLVGIFAVLLIGALFA